MLKSYQMTRRLSLYDISQQKMPETALATYSLCGNKPDKTQNNTSTKKDQHHVSGGREQVAKDGQSADQSLPTFVIPEVKIQKEIFLMHVKGRVIVPSNPLHLPLLPDSLQYKMLNHPAMLMLSIRH